MRVYHFSYHKNLTVFFARVAGAHARLRGRRYRHFNSLAGAFWREHAQYDIVSLNNHHGDLARLPAGARVSRFLRDPRDLVVSGYFYHRRGAEPWCRTPPDAAGWAVVNGTVPEAMPPATSYSAYLQGLDREAGLLAEIEFRSRHFESMLRWQEDPAILTLRYEDILGREGAAFRRLARHYGFGRLDTLLWVQLARLHAAGGWRAGRSRHIRDPRPSQWRTVFTPRVRRVFEDRYGPLVERLGYEI